MKRIEELTLRDIQKGKEALETQYNNAKQVVADLTKEPVNKDISRFVVLTAAKAAEDLLEDPKIYRNLSILEGVVQTIGLKVLVELPAELSSVAPIGQKVPLSFLYAMVNLHRFRAEIIHTSTIAVPSGTASLFGFADAHNLRADAQQQRLFGELQQLYDRSCNTTLVWETGRDSLWLGAEELVREVLQVVCDTLVGKEGL